MASCAAVVSSRGLSPQVLGGATGYWGFPPKVESHALTARRDDSVATDVPRLQLCYPTSPSGTFQISSQYCLMARSDEKVPERAVLRMDMRLHRRLLM